MNVIDQKKIKILSKKNLFFSLIEIFTSWSIIIISLYFALYTEFTSVKILCFLLISSRQYSLLLLMHDGIHYALCESKKINDFLGEYLLAFPIGALFQVGRQRHQLHHGKFSKTEDPDRKFYYIPKGNKISFFSHLKTTITFLFFNYAILKKDIFDQSQKSKIEKYKFLIKMTICQLLILSILTWLSSSIFFYFIFWLLPIVNFALFFDKFRLFCEHAPSPLDPNSAIVTRHFKSNALERFFLAPMHANYHISHHVFPGLSHRMLAQSYTLLDPEALENCQEEGSYLFFYWKNFVKKHQPTGG